MRLLLSVAFTLLTVVPALCWPVNDDVEKPHALANANPGVQDQVFQDYPETQDYVNDVYYYAASQGNPMHALHTCISDSLSLVM